MDMQPTLAPKSDRLNSDDLIAGPKTITITKMSPGAEPQQVAVYFEGDNGKPYYPCKSMRRVMVAAWGTDGSSYVGRQMTLFRDPEVSYGGIQVGGIRISHMSHLDADLSIALTITRGKRAPYKVQRLVVTPAPASMDQQVEGALAAIAKATKVAVLEQLQNTCQQKLNNKEIPQNVYDTILAAIESRINHLTQSKGNQP